MLAPNRAEALGTDWPNREAVLAPPLCEVPPAGKLSTEGRFVWKRPDRSLQAFWFFPGIAALFMRALINFAPLRVTGVKVRG
jgi:hypothetical protein